MFFITVKAWTLITELFDMLRTDDYATKSSLQYQEDMKVFNYAIEDTMIILRDDNADQSAHVSIRRIWNPVKHLRSSFLWK